VLSDFSRFDEAMAVAGDYHRMYPDNWQAYGWATSILANQGREQDALKVYYRAFQLDQDSMPYDLLLWHLIDDLSAPDGLGTAWLDYWKARKGEDYLRLGTDLGVEIAYYIVSGQAERATRFTEQALEAGAISPTAYAPYFILRAVPDYQRVRELYEQDFSRQHLDPFDLDLSTLRWNIAARWGFSTAYALASKHTGEPEKSRELAANILAHVEFLLGQGMLFGSAEVTLYFHEAMIAAILDLPERAIAALRRAAETGYHVCGSCLRLFPHFNNLRGMPEFDAVVTEIEARNAAAIQSLSAKGILLTPDEVLALDQFEFGPFAE